MKIVESTTSKAGSDCQGLPKIGYSMRETALILGVSYMSVFRLAQRGLLRPSRALRTKVFSLDEIERFLRETSQ